MVDEGKLLQAIEIAKNTGKIKIGTNEATKQVERGAAKLIVIADDVNPKEITMHLPPLCEEKKILLMRVKAKLDLGKAAGIGVGTAAVSILDEGDAKKLIAELSKEK